MLRFVLSRITPEQAEMLAQLIRYVFLGGFVTIVHLCIYWTAAKPLHVAPLLANIVAQTVSTTLGYNIHSRVTFRGHGTRDNVARTGGRFLVVTAFGFFLNSFWVWLFTGLLHGPVWWPMPFMAFATPLAVFWLNRLWVFA